ncbi:MAG: hypothetical protein AAGB26_15935 [Planctomycetota bacterium]
MSEYLRFGSWGGVLVGLFFAVALVLPAEAGINPGFVFSTSNQLATDIVEVVEVEVEGKPGAYRVISVWRGGLAEGFVFEPGEIKLHKDSFEWKVTVANHGKQPPWTEVTIEPASIVLFLRDNEKVKDDRRVDEGKPALRWLPADEHFRTHYRSALYITGRRAYELQQFANPGPLRPESLKSLAYYREKVERQDRLMAWLDEAEQAAFDDSVDELIEIYRIGIVEHYGAVRSRAKQALSTKGQHAYDKIRQLRLFSRYPLGQINNAMHRAQPEILELLSKVGTTGLGPSDLLYQIELSQAYFKQLVEQEDPWPADSSVRQETEYEMLVTSLMLLPERVVKYQLARIGAVREQWMQPPLRQYAEGQYGEKNIIKLCDRLLAAKADD